MPAPRGARRRQGEKVWSGRMAARTDPAVEAFTTSIGADYRLHAEDIAGSRAHARMLRAVGLLSAAEQRAIDSGLRSIAAEFESSAFIVEPGDEDIHTAVERRLVELVGEPGRKLHTARSRNDQVATDLRLWCKRRCRELMLAAAALQEALLERAREHRRTILPGYTHLQRAQVVSLAHHLLAYFEMLDRDVGRLADCHRRCDVLPLGSGALASTTLPLDRRRVATELGFAALSANSLDAVGDRDFAVELSGACALCMVHLSRLAEELVLWSSTEFGFAELPDSHATGSSLMPQKKNPDPLELVRGRVGRVVGAQVALLTTLKGLPLAYNRDLQEDKASLFDAVDTTAACLAMAADIVRVVQFDTAAMAAAAADPGLMATDVVDHLVRRGVAFREAHRLVGRAVRAAARRGCALDELTPADWATIDGRAGEAAVVTLFDPARSLARHGLEGGPSPREVGRQLTRARARIAATRKLVTSLAGTHGRAG
ncbi:MAG TPA: argininosuccinate lyase [Candidatus Dormibacteraeota bacterium]